MTYAAEVLADAPDLYWELEDLASVTHPVDSSGNGLDASISGTPNPGFAQAAVFAALGTSLGLNGTGGSNYIYRNYDSSLDVGTGDFTFEFVCYCDNGTGNYVEMWSRDAGASGNGQLLYLQAGTGAIRLWLGGSVLVGAKRISDSVPHHVIIERVSGIVSCYIDAALDCSATMAGNTDRSSPIHLGVTDGSYSTFDGRYGHFAYYKHALSAARRNVHATALGLWVPTGNPNQRGFGYSYENVGFSVVDKQEAYGYEYENVGFSVVDKQEAYGYEYENIGYHIVNTQEAHGYAYENIGDSKLDAKEAYGYVYEDETIYIPSYWGQKI